MSETKSMLPKDFEPIRSVKDISGTSRSGSRSTMKLEKNYMPLKFRIAVAIHEILGYLIFVGLPSVFVLSMGGILIWHYCGLELAHTFTVWTLVVYGSAFFLFACLNFLTFSWGESEIHHGSTGQ